MQLIEQLKKLPMEGTSIRYIPRDSEYIMLGEFTLENYPNPVYGYIDKNSMAIYLRPADLFHKFELISAPLSHVDLDPKVMEAKVKIEDKGEWLGAEVNLDTYSVKLI